MTDLAIGLAGCAGRMGPALVRRIAAADGCHLVGAIERAGHEVLEHDAGVLAGIVPLGVTIG